jgi:NADP-dependent 3-hydroxy acid dehydrogenase YdfG
MSDRSAAAVVTDAAMGMGLEIARRLVTDGVSVVGIDVNADALDQARAELGDGFEPLAGDVGGWDTHVRVADAAEQRGPLRHWVNNAGIDIVGGAHEVTPEHIEHGLRVRQHGVMFGCALAVRRMLPVRTGSIVNISSIQGVAAWPAYA